MKEKIEAVLSKHNFIDSEYANVFEAMSEILDLVADRIEEKEPGASNGIARYREVARNIYDMEQFIEDYSY